MEIFSLDLSQEAKKSWGEKRSRRRRGLKYWLVGASLGWGRARSGGGEWTMLGNKVASGGFRSMRVLQSIIKYSKVTYRTYLGKCVSNKYM